MGGGPQHRDVLSDVTSGSKAATSRRVKRLLEYVEAGDTVVVWRVGRLGRSLIDVVNTVSLLAPPHHPAPRLPRLPAGQEIRGLTMDHGVPNVDAGGPTIDQQTSDLVKEMSPLQPPETSLMS